ncbi:DNA methyltransferase [Pedobacter sp. Leaf250]|uniref:Eco57I restriction-modification methylase domain-containing protein n=1 Tax=Pedobacter sp. Leaf250 TaxID=2876559 RepID=UPI001E4CF8F4|nr:DNA methyltransferase [Pedobacter sp. Leaf250]
MNYSAISIQGNIFTSEILEKIRQEDTRFQGAKDFNLNQGDSVRDEINIAWSLATSHWNAFKQKRESLSLTDTGTTETRRYWILPLLQILGYDVSQSNAEIINDKSYAVSHRANNKDGFPIHVVGIQQSLDKKADIGGARLSPHALIQEYLNNTEHLYGFATNGAMLRVLRDATRLSRLSYVEFNLEQMMEEGLYVEFALLYRTLHSSRIANKKEENAESFIEWYHQEALSSGSRIRERLSQAVEQSILLLANGILENSNNESLRQQIDENKITPHQYYLHVLRSVYRILFLLVIEERKLIFPEKRDDELNRKRNVYYKFYSIQRLTYLVEKKVYIDPRKTDLWQSLLTTFHLFEYSDQGAKLGISALGSGLFAPNALGGLQDQLVNNETLLKVLRYLVTFENENRQLVRVNYADLDVEEFGSIYEGLLEYAPAITNYQFNFVKGDERSSSGSHYTPEELVKPLIVHSLDYLIADKLKEVDPEAGLLSLNICDVACGSGHILLSAARRVGFELAKYRSKEDQPTPSVLRIAIRDVIKSCIYGVDLNPLAVELCKVALWLEAHEPGQPMNFLDHHIKCGNAIVGLAHFEELENGIASEAFKALPGDEKEIATAFKKRNDFERKIKNQLITYNVEQIDDSLRGFQKSFQEFTSLPENSPEQIWAKEVAYNTLTNGKKWRRLKQLADLQVAQFFIPKTDVNKVKLTTQSQYIDYLKNGSQIIDRGAAMAVSEQKRFFHWFLEFPQVFQNGGFDCILGNPPFLGGKKISGAYGDQYLNFIKSYFEPSNGGLDLVVYFFRRIYQIVKKTGFQSLISTNTICQGDSRIGGLDYIVANNGSINFAIKSMKWPGLAAVDISLLTIYKGEWGANFNLNNKKVQKINSNLDDSETSYNPFPLSKNINKGFIGSYVLGSGFILSEAEAAEIISKDPKSKEVIQKFLNADDINTDIYQRPSRYIINFFDWNEKYSSENYPFCFKIIEERVKPERIISPDKGYSERWWQYGRRAVDLYRTISPLNRFLVVPLTTKYLSFSFVDQEMVISHAAGAVAFDNYANFSIISNTFHEQWAWLLSSTMGGNTLRYTPSSALSTFPFPEGLNSESISKLESIGEHYHEYRRQLMIGFQFGLTKTYNLFHCRSIKSTYVDAKDKQVVALQNHLEKVTDSISFEGAIQGIIRLRELHQEMDETVLGAYLWQDIDLRHDFYEVDYLPENDRVRYTIHPEARKEVLKRLLQLNHKIHKEEVNAGLWEKKKPVKKEKKAETKGIRIEHKKINQVSLFDIEQSLGMKEFSLNEGIYSVIDAANIIKQPVDKIRRWFKKLSEVDYEGLDGTAKTDIEKRRISFHGLIELVVIGTLLENGSKISDVITARKNLKDITSKEYPFATNNVRDNLKKSGSSIIFRTSHGDVTLDGTSQFNLDFIYLFFDEIVFENDIAVRIMPAKGNGQIIIDPKLASGKPSFINHSDLEVEMILGFYEDESSIDELMENYNLTKKEIESALSYAS